MVTDIFSIPLVDALQWAGAIAGLTGAAVLALNNRFSKWGWFGFLAANCFIGGYALMVDATGLLVQQIGFTATSTLGVWKSDFHWLRRFKAASGQDSRTVATNGPCLREPSANGT